ncbi:MAG: M1 family metallopeptidase [Bacteroidota bacterium]
MKALLTSIILFSTLFTACRTTKKNKALLRTIDTVSVSAYNNPMSIYRATAARIWNIVHTRVALSFDYKNKTAEGQEWITLQPYYYPTDTLTLDAKGMKIKSVTIGHLDKALSYTYDSSELHIILDKKYSKEEQIKLSIQYTAMPYATKSGGSAAITDDRGLYFINADEKAEGKPIQIWTQGETEANSHWLPTIDKPNSRTTVQIELTVPSKYKTLSNGEMIASIDNGWTRTDIWKMDKPIQVYAIMFAIGDFAIAKEKWKNKEVNYYVEPAYAAYAKKMFQYTPEMIEFFSNVTGVAYPWNKYSQVVVRDYVSGAMENTSASLFGEFMNQDHREYADGNHEDVVSHELFHQWFGDYVTAESWSNLTVNESFATYGEYLWRKQKYGLSYADELAWNYLQRYLYFTDYSDPVLVRHYYRDKEEMFDAVSYQKGGAILHYMHEIMGDSAFYKSMQIYLTKNALNAAEATHWRLAVEEATGKDWNVFFNEWYNRAGHPVLDINYNYNDVAKKLEVTVNQTQKEPTGLYHLPLKTLLINGSEKMVINWDISKRKETFIYEYKNGERPVLVPDVVHVLPGIIKENKGHKEWLVQMSHCNDFVSQFLAIHHIDKKDISKPDVQSIISLGLNNKSASIRVATLELMGSIETESLRNKWKPEIVMLATNDGNNIARSMAIELLGNWKINEQKQLMIESVTDSSYYVAGNALEALSKIDDTMAYTLARKNLNGRAKTNLDVKAWAIVAAKAKNEDTAILKQFVLNKNDAEKRNHLISDLVIFANNTRTEQSFNLAVDLLADKIRNTENKSYRVYYAGFFKKIKENRNLLLNKDKKNAQLLRELNFLKSTIQKLNAEEKEEEVQKVYEALK